MQHSSEIPIYRPTPDTQFPKMDKWHGKVALVTGASGGIGANITIALANAGMIVIALGRRVDAIEVCNKSIFYSISPHSFTIFGTHTVIQTLYNRFKFQIHISQTLQTDVTHGSGGKIVARKCDVTDEAQLLLTFKSIKDDYGRLDVLVNNAGVIKSDLVLGKHTLGTP